jgi:putative aminopeptidase FrvX
LSVAQLGGWTEPSRGGGRVALRAPEQSRGLATVVATHVARGQVHTATARVEIAPATDVALTAVADRC